jgi:hypothetical protein
LLMNIEKLRPLGDWVLLEAAIESVTESGLIIPIAALARFPVLAEVIRTGTRCTGPINEGDFALIEDEGFDTGTNYTKYCSLNLKDWPHREFCDMEFFDQIRETVEKHRANPSTENYQLHVNTVDGTWVSFLASDVLEYQIEDVSEPGTKVEYVQAIRFFTRKDGLEKLFYLVREPMILATVEF